MKIISSINSSDHVDAFHRKKFSSSNCVLLFDTFSYTKLHLGAMTNG